MAEEEVWLLRNCMISGSSITPAIPLNRYTWVEPLQIQTTSDRLSGGSCWKDRLRYHAGFKGDSVRLPVRSPERVAAYTLQLQVAQWDHRTNVWEMSVSVVPR